MGVGRKIIRGFLTLSTAEVVSKILFFLATIYLARTLGPAQYGLISFALALLTYFSLGANLGLDTLGIRTIARNKAEVKTQAQQILPLKFFLGLCSLLLLILVLFLIDKPLAEKQLILLFALSILPMTILIEWVFQGLERFALVGWSRIINNLFFVLAVVLFVKNAANIIYVPLFKLASLSLAGLFLFVNFWRSFGWLKLQINVSAWKSLIRQSWPMGLYMIMGLVMANLDIVMLGFMRSNQEVGYYGAVYKFIGVWIVLIGAFLNIVFPVIAHFFTSSRPDFQRVVNQSIKLILIFALPIALVGPLLADQLIVIVFGGQYLAGSLAFRILLWTMLPISLNSVIAWSLLAANDEKKVIRILLWQTIVNVGLNLVLIPIYGIAGAAVATFISELIGVLFYYQTLKRHLQPNISSYLIRQLLAAMVMMLLFSVLRGLTIYLLLPVAALTYFICLILAGAISKDELQRFAGYF
ncbi:flippase [Candidatus Margulisiibacteriota bacterium]